MQQHNQDHNEPIYIHMLGDFSITQGTKVISDSSNRTRQLWSLLGYLLVNRQKEITRDELVEVLWPDRESNNPANALKNLIYRLRAIFEEFGFPFARDMILFGHGGYSWNNQLPCVVDVEEFEKLTRASVAEEHQELETLEKALQLYQGDLLCGTFYQSWVQPYAETFRDLYLQAVYRVCDLYCEKQMHQQAQTYCERALELVPLEDKLHRTMIELLLEQGKQEQALRHYNYAVDLFYRMVGNQPSEELRSLYREITRTVNDVETDLNMIKQDLQERQIKPGAFYCNYEVFKDIYRVEVRSASRSGRLVFVGLLTLTDTQGAVPQPTRLAAATDRLYELIRRSLRKGDMFCRFSASQYMLMLPTQTFESGYLVLSRICKKFRREARFKDLCIQASLQPLNSVDEEENKR